MNIMKLIVTGILFIMKIKKTLLNIGLIVVEIMAIVFIPYGIGRLICPPQEIIFNWLAGFIILIFGVMLLGMISCGVYGLFKANQNWVNKK